MRGTVLMLLIAAALAAGLWWTSGEGSETRDPSTVTGGERALEGYRLADATRIAFRPRPAVEELVVEREGGTWRLVEPLIDLASKSKLASMAGAYDNALLTPAKPAAELSDDYLAQTGLAEPEAWIEFTFAGRDEPLRLAFGAPGPLGDDRFVRKDGGAVYRAQHALLSVLQATRFEMRSRQLIGARPFDVDRVVLERKGVGGTRERLEIRRAGAQGFRLLEPDVQLDGNAVLGFLQILCGLSVDRFLPGAFVVDDLEGPAREPDVRLEVGALGGTDTVELYRSGAGAINGRHLERNIAFHIDDVDFDRTFGVPLEALRARALFSFEVEEIEQIALDPGRGNGVPFVLERLGAGGYRMVEPIPSRCAATPVAELISALRRLGIRQFVADEIDDPERFGLGERAARLVLEGALASQRDEIEIGRVADEDARFVYARRAGEGSVGLLDRRIAELILQPWTAYVDLQVFEYSPREHVGRLRIARQGGEPVVYERGPEGLWNAGGNAARNVLDVVVLLTDLEAEKAWPESAFGDDGVRASYDLQLLRGNGDRLARFELLEVEPAEGDTNPDRRAVIRRPGGKLWFELRRRDAQDILELAD